MRQTAFYNSFDTVATLEELTKEIKKILPEFENHKRACLLQMAVNVFNDYLVRTNTVSVDKTAFLAFAKELKLGPRTFLSELLENFTFREVIEWQSDRNQMDGRSPTARRLSESF